MWNSSVFSRLYTCWVVQQACAVRGDIQDTEFNKSYYYFFVKYAIVFRQYINKWYSEYDKQRRARKAEKMFYIYGIKSMSVYRKTGSCKLEMQRIASQEINHVISVSIHACVVDMRFVLVRRAVFEVDSTPHLGITCTLIDDAGTRLLPISKKCII